MSDSNGLVKGDDGKRRCVWQRGAPEYAAYHDREWGRPVADDVRLFEKICLEGFQSGLSWLTILRKRENFRNAFAGFDFDRISRFTQRDVDRLLDDAGIVRHRGKIESTVNNAQRALELVHRKQARLLRTSGASNRTRRRVRSGSTRRGVERDEHISGVSRPVEGS